MNVTEPYSFIVCVGKEQQFFFRFFFLGVLWCFSVLRLYMPNSFHLLSHTSYTTRSTMGPPGPHGHETRLPRYSLRLDGAPITHLLSEQGGEDEEGVLDGCTRPSFIVTGWRGVIHVVRCNMDKEKNDKGKLLSGFKQPLVVDFI